MKNKLVSIENASLIRKFTVLFIVMSLLPFLIITYFFVQYNNTGKLIINPNMLMLLLFLTGIGALAGFWGMRSSIVKIQNITKQARGILNKDMFGLHAFGGEENEVTQLARAFNEVTKNLEDNIRQLESSKRTMQYVLSKISMGVSSLQNIDTFLDLIVEITTQALDAKRGILMLFDEKSQELYVKTVSGVQASFMDLRVKLGEQGPGWVAKHKKPLLIPQLQKIDSSQNETDPFSPPLLCAPLTYQDRMVGVLTVTGRISGASFSEDELVMISNLASQTAVAVENDRLHEDAEKTYLETISALAIAVEARDPYSRGHLERVSKYAVNTARKLGLDEKSIKEIKSAAELHDLGKIGISDDILRKDSYLNEGETRIMHRHPIIGEAIIKPVRSLSNLCDLVRHHHEWVDGSGYPDRLKGDEISLGAKILGIVDSFDAMTTERPYGRALSAEEAREDLKKHIGIRYDGKIVEAFLSTL